MSSKAAANKKEVHGVLSKSKLNLPGEAMGGTGNVDGAAPDAAEDTPKRGVSWQDFHGKELTQVREFEPSEQSDTDDEEGGRSKGCCCVVS